MQGLMRAICLIYLIYLTALLLIADPRRLVVGHGDLPGFLRTLMPVAHLVSFWLLAVLALVARWPAPRWAITLLLIAYAGMTEVAQSMLPPRTAEWKDWIQDLAGIAIGAALCWIAAICLGVFRNTRRMAEERVASETPDQWEVMQGAWSRPSARNPSWWG
jgi:hypothetical protein